MVEFLKYQILQDQKWVALLEALIKFSNNKQLQIRQAAVYGLGIWAQESPVQIFANYQ